MPAGDLQHFDFGIDLGRSDAETDHEPAHAVARSTLPALLACTASLAACAAKHQDPPLLAVAAGTEPRLGPGALTESSVISTEATVVAIDHQTRMVTLRTPDQRLHTLRVDPSIRNLGKVRKRDEVSPRTTNPSPSQ